MIDRRQFTQSLLAAGALGAFGTGAMASQTRGKLVGTVVVDARSGRQLFRDGPCEQRFYPQSTFKFPIAVMGYDAGILKDTHDPTLDYRPDYHASSAREKITVDPTIWLKESIVWYSQQITRQLGMERFRRYVEAFGYGNADVTGNPGKNDGLTQAWLMSSLLISPDEQVRFVLKFLGRQLSVSDRAYALTTATMPVFPAEGGWQVHGKTGSGWLRDAAGATDRTRPLGWFVGWGDKDDRRVAFARVEVGDRKPEQPAGFIARAAVLADLARMAGAA